MVVVVGATVVVVVGAACVVGAFVVVVVFVGACVGGFKQTEEEKYGNETRIPKSLTTYYY